MKINLSDRLIAYLALISGLSISAVAIYYSVAGLISIFAAAAIPIAIMGIVLEVGKLSATVWLKQNWLLAPKFLKTYLFIAITVLMLITSMGIFGYLSKAHLDQAVPTGDVAAKVSLLDEKIKTERDNIETARSALKQMDAQVDQIMSRTDNEKGAERAVQIRRNQQAERGRLQADIAKSQARIAQLNEERAPIASELRKVEAEVGPIKYIAALIYGDNPDANLLEAAVRWVIIIIVLVFDPLAVILLLASQYSFAWFRQQNQEAEEMASDLYELEKAIDNKNNDTLKEESDVSPFPTVEEITPKDEPPVDEIKVTPETHAYLYKPWVWKVPGQEPIGPLVYKPEEDKYEQEEHEELHHPDDSAEIKAAKTKWKHDHPNDSLKRHRKLYEQGLITNLPWEDYLLKAKPDFVIDTEDQEAAIEAAKWAEERLTSKKKGNDLDGEGRESSDKKEQGTLEGYIQNAEQNESTIWQRVKKAKEG